MLGANFTNTHNKYLHTLGNLTLTGYNPELGQKSFNEKKEIYKHSHIELNNYFIDIENWNEKEIIKRANILSEKALKIWNNID